MRVQVTPQRVELLEGVPFQIQVTVTNTGTLIGGYHLRILGADPSWVRLESENLSLFPDGSEMVTATVTVPKGLGAGDRRIAVQVRELTPPGAISITEIDLVVPARQAIRLALTPITVICGGTARFGVVLENSGNTVLPVSPVGLDPEEKIQFVFDPPVVVLAPGEHAMTDLRASARRRWFGAPVARTFSLGLPPEPPEIEPGQPLPAPDPIEPLVTGSMLQKPRLGRGALSLLSLLVAVSVFAVVITIALSRLVGVSAADRDLALQVAAARQSGAVSGDSTVGGQVKLLSDAAPASGVAVDIFSAAALGSPLASTATNAQGKWSTPALPAGSYKLRFRAAGFAEVWYPGALNSTDAQPVDLQVGQKVSNLAVTLGGLPGTITGQIVGDDVAGAVLTLSVPLEALPRGGAPPSATAAPTGPSVITGAPVSPAPPTTSPTPTSTSSGSAGANTPGATVRTVPIGSDGTFTLDDVPSPSVYDLTVVKAGYAASTQRVDLDGGEDRTGVELRLRTGDGLITGVVTSPSGPLGGAVVTATSGRTTVKTVTLTQGTVGAFTLRGLVTPGSYTVTVMSAGFAAQSSTLTLTSGQKLAGVQFALAKTAGSISGSVTLLPDNTPASGVTVTVTTGATTITTVTQSAGTVGSWTIAGLPIPGAYTITFSRPDLQSQTVAVSLDATGAVSGGTGPGGGITVSMKSATAIITGTVTQRAAGGSISKVGEAVISLSSGTDTYTVTSASVPSNQLGHYEITGVVPGTYTLSASRRGTSPTTVIVTVAAGQILTFDPVMIPPASIGGTITDRTGGSVLGLQILLYQSAQYPAQVYRSTTTDENGHYSFPDVDAPQAYVLEVRSTTTGPLGSSTLVVSASQEVTLDLTVGVAPTTTVEGTPTTVSSPAPTVSTPATGTLAPATGVPTTGLPATGVTATGAAATGAAATGTLVAATAPATTCTPAPDRPCP